MSDNLENAAYCVEYFHAKPGYRDQLVAGLLKLITPTQAEKGCLLYDLLPRQQRSKSCNFNSQV